MTKINFFLLTSFLNINKCEVKEENDNIPVEEDEKPSYNNGISTVGSLLMIISALELLVVVVKKYHNQKVNIPFKGNSQLPLDQQKLLLDHKTNKLYYGQNSYVDKSRKELYILEGKIRANTINYFGEKYALNKNILSENEKIAYELLPYMRLDNDEEIKYDDSCYEVEMVNNEMTRISLSQINNEKKTRNFVTFHEEDADISQTEIFLTKKNNVMNILFTYIIEANKEYMDFYVINKYPPNRRIEIFLKKDKVALLKGNDKICRTIIENSGDGNNCSIYALCASIACQWARINVENKFEDYKKMLLKKYCEKIYFFNKFLDFILLCKKNSISKHREIFSSSMKEINDRKQNPHGEYTILYKNLLELLTYPLVNIQSIFNTPFSFKSSMNINDIFLDYLTKLSEKLIEVCRMDEIFLNKSFGFLDYAVVASVVELFKATMAKSKDYSFTYMQEVKGVPTAIHYVELGLNVLPIQNIHNTHFPFHFYYLFSDKTEYLKLLTQYHTVLKTNPIKFQIEETAEI